MKGLKGIVSVLLIATMALAFSACGSVKAVAPKEFKSAVKDVMDCDKDDLYEGDGYVDYVDSYIEYDGEDWDKYTIEITEYEDEDAAKYVFESRVNSFNFYKSHDGIDGKIKITKNYIVVDAEVVTSYDGDGIDMYGGYYLAENYIIQVTTNTGKDKDRDVVDEMIEALGYPKPSRA